MPHPRIHRGKITALFCIALLTPEFAAADVVRGEREFGCRSREAFQIFKKFISKRDTTSIGNALKNGECIRIPFGIDVEIVKGKGNFFYYSVVHLPGDQREWWISPYAFMSAIELEKYEADLDALENEISQLGRGEKEKAFPGSSTKHEEWNSVPAQLPVAQKDQIVTPAEFFRTTKKSVWVVVALKSAADAAEPQVSAQGSAVAVSPSHLITNCHVTDGAERLVLTQGDEQFDAVLLSADAVSDRCILTARKVLPSYIRGVRRFSELEIGERVFTIGSPQGLEQTLGEGLISGMRSGDYVRYIQTSAPISPGSSGGGLFDSAGNLLGITTFMLKESQALNFAIAAEDFWRSK